MIDDHVIADHEARVFRKEGLVVGNVVRPFAHRGHDSAGCGSYDRDSEADPILFLLDVAVKGFSVLVHHGQVERVALAVAIASS